MKKVIGVIAAVLIMMALAITLVKVVPEGTAMRPESQKSILDIIKLAKAIKLSNNKIELGQGETFKLKLKNKPKNTTAEFSLKSNNKYFTVSSGGTVRAKSFYGDKEINAKIQVTIKLKGVEVITIERPVKLQLRGKGSKKTDYSSAEALEKAIREGKNVKGKVVQFVVATSNQKSISTPVGKFGYYMTSGKTVFVSGTSRNKKTGSKAKVRIIRAFKAFGKYYVAYGNV